MSTSAPNWSAPSLEAFIESFQWPSPATFADDVLKFIAERKAVEVVVQPSWTEAEIRAAYFSKANDTEGVTGEDDLIEALKETRK